ncbi:50S ribosomal protein L24e [Candidatus Woesearchaeota archaeon]|nr:50S ribosomal protein L24e [Candidatus Woesearchaeota archaeon]
MAKCTFCGESFNNRGKMFVQTSGKVLYFCSNKCEKNMLKLKRKPRDMKWVTSKNKTEKK